MRGYGRAWPEGKLVTNLQLLERYGAQENLPPAVIRGMEKRITENFGVVSRYMSHLPGDPFTDDEDTSEKLALRATRAALGRHLPDSIEAYILGSTTSRRYTGSQASSVLGQLGVKAPAYEFKAGCSTSLAAIHLAQGLLASGYPNVMVTCAETLSKVADPKVKESWFGLADGAGALWMETPGPGTQPDFKIIKSAFSTQGALVDLYTTPGDLPPRQGAVEAGEYYLAGDSGAMRSAARDHYLKLIEAVLPDPTDRRKIRWVVPHQVSRPLIAEVMKETGLQGELVWNAEEFGNVGGASVLFSLAYALEKKLFSPGDLVFLMSVGGGLSFAAQLWQALA